MTKRIPIHVKVRNIVQRRVDKLHRIADYKLGGSGRRFRMKRGAYQARAKAEILEWVIGVFEKEKEKGPHR